MTKLRELVKDDIISDVDGFYYYFPKNNGGSLSAHVLREIASILDKMNESWEKQITEYFENQVQDTGLFEDILVGPSEEVLVFGDFVDE